MWIDNDVLANVQDIEPLRGRQRLYSVALVQALIGEDSAPFAVARLAKLCAKPIRYVWINCTLYGTFLTERTLLPDRTLLSVDSARWSSDE